MPDSEFDIIQRYFARPFGKCESVVLGIGDDAAILSPSPNRQLVVSIDSLLAGVHFPHSTAAEQVAAKALAVNLSDLAAMGATPAWFTLALSLPEIDHDWLAAFSEGLAEMASACGLALIGGDTTRGPLAVTIQIAGYVQPGKALLRSGARAGDRIFVTGSIGDAALGLYALRHRCGKKADTDYLIERLNRPQPRIEAGQALQGVASACIDVSDGLFADLGHILDASGVGARVREAEIPRSPAASAFLAERAELWPSFANRGDDYELCFCVPRENLEKIAALEKRLDCRLSCIGEIVAQKGLQVLDEQGRPIDIGHDNYDHFASAP